MPISVVVPPSLNAGSMNRLLDATIQNGHPVDGEITLDFSRLFFYESIGIVILSNLVEWLRSRGVTVHFSNATRDNGAVAYLDDVGFFKAYWDAPLSPLARLRDSTFPFRALQCADSHQWIDGNIFPWLQSKLHCHDAALYRMKAAIREVFNNISDHSEMNVGCMHVQWYPAIETVKIAISDFGIGISAEVRKVVPNATDPAALAWATTNGNSTKNGRNMGAGLTYLIENVVKYHRGWLGLYSGSGSITFNHVTQIGNLSALPGVYPGTLINMILRTGIMPDDEEGVVELKW